MEDGIGLRGGRGLKFEKLELSVSHASQGIFGTHITPAFLSSGRILCNGYALFREPHAVFVVGRIL